MTGRFSAQAWLLGLLAAGAVSMFPVNVLSPRPTSERIPGRCTRACHDKVCRHFGLRWGGARWYLAVDSLYRVTIALLKRAPGLRYSQTCVLVYVVAWPALLFFLAWIVDRAASPPRPDAVLHAAMIGSVDGIVRWLYWQCTDYTVNLGNLTGLTYQGVNIALFLFGYPALTSSLVAIILLRRRQCPG